MPKIDWNAIVRFAPITNPIPTMTIDMKTSIRMHYRICCPAQQLDGELEVGSGVAISTTEHTENTEQCCFSLCTLCSLWFFLCKKIIQNL